METAVDHFARNQHVLEGTNFLWLQKRLPCVNVVDKTVMREAPADYSQYILVQYGYQAASLEAQLP